MKKQPKPISQTSQNCLECNKTTNTKEKICVQCQLKTNLQKLINVKLISKEDLPKLFQHLELPKEIENLSFRQVKKVERILHQIKSKTFDLNVLRSKPKSNKSNNSEISRISSSASTPQPNAVKSQKQSSRRRGVTGRLVQILQKRERGRCFWCDIPVIRVSAVLAECRLEQKKFTLVYFNEDKIITETAIASVDHLVRYAENGSLSPENTVLSCIKCNNTRGYEEEKEKLNQKRCFFCGKEFDDIKNQRCISCLERFSLFELENKQTQTNNQEKKKNIWNRIKEIIADIFK